MPTNRRFLAAATISGYFELNAVLNQEVRLIMFRSLDLQSKTMKHGLRIVSVLWCCLILNNGQICFEFLLLLVFSRLKLSVWGR